MLVKTLQEVEKYSTDIMKTLQEEECNRKVSLCKPEGEAAGFPEEYYKRMKHKGIMETHQKLYQDVVELKANTGALQDMLKAKEAQRSTEGEAAEGSIPAKESEASLHSDAREQGWQELLRECHAAMNGPKVA